MKKTFTKKRVCEKRGRSFFLSLFVFLLLAGFTKNAQAQLGANCTNAKALSTCINDSISTENTAWYSFKANAVSENIVVSNSIISGNSIIHTMKAYASCSGAAIDSVSAMNDTTSTLTLSLTGLTINNTYYVSISNNYGSFSLCRACANGEANYQICTQPPPYTPAMACITQDPNGDPSSYQCCTFDKNYPNVPCTFTFCESSGNAPTKFFISGFNIQPPSTGVDPELYIYKNDSLIMTKNDFGSGIPNSDGTYDVSYSNIYFYNPNAAGTYKFVISSISFSVVVEAPLVPSFTTSIVSCTNNVIATNTTNDSNSSDLFSWSNTNYNIYCYPTCQLGAMINSDSPGVDTLALNIINTCGSYSTYQVVKIDTVPNITMNGPNLVCDTSSSGFVYCAEGVKATCYQYNWTANGGTIVGSSDSGCVKVNWASTVGGTLYAAVKNTNTPSGVPVTVTDSLVVRGCCSGSIVLDDDSTSGLGTEITAHPSNFKKIANTYTINGLSGASALTINGTFNVTNNLLINNCEVVLGPNAKITVAPGVEFYILNSHFHACSNMWDGIYINGTTSSGSYVLEVQNSSIEDAEHAIVSANGGYYFVRNSILNQNYQNIVVLPFNGSHQGNIINSTIECYDNATSYSYNSGTNTLRAPFAGQITYQGININNVNNIDVGKTLFGNTFDNVAYGIVSKASTVTVSDNIFSNIQPPMGSTAIVASGNSAGTSSLYVGTGVALNKNTFTNCNVGILAQDTINAYISNNTFNMNRNTSSNVCVELFNNYHRTLSVTQNTMQHVSFGVDAITNMNALVNIHDNTISRATSDPHSISTGVLVGEAVPSAATHYNIYKNTIGTLSNGISTTNLWGASITDNTITLNGYSKAPYNEGIIMYNAEKCNTLRNNITGPTTPNNTDGIRFELGGGNKIECNTTQYTGNGLYFSGSQTSPDEYVAKNKMENNANGLVLNSGGAIGPQGGINAPNDNEWIGTFSNYGAYTIGSNGNNSPFYVQATSIYNTTSGAVSGSFPIPFHTTGGNLNCLVCLPNYVGPPCPPISPVLSELMAVINNSVSYPVFSIQNKWRGAHNLYKYLQQDSSLVISSSVVKQFRDSLAQSNMGKLEVINQALSDSNAITAANVSQAQLASSAIASPDTLEQTSKTVSDILITMQSAGQELPNASQISTLQTIAALCPYQYGAGVYTARAMLSRVDTTHYTNNCEELDDVPSGRRHLNPQSQQDSTEATLFKLFPNPNNGNMTFEYSLSQGNNGQLIILDMLGQTVKMYNLQQGNDNKLQISESALKNGVYFYQVVINNVVIKSNKLVIIK